MDDLTRDTAKSYLWNQVAMVCDGLTISAAMALVGRLAGKEALGVMGRVMSAVGFAVLLGGLGFKEGCAVLVQRTRDNRRALGGLLRRYLCVRAVSALLAACIVAAVLTWGTTRATATAAGAYVFVLLIATLFSSFDVALFKTHIVAAGKMASAVVALGFVAVFAYTGSLPGIFAGLCLGAVAAASVFFIPLKALISGETEKYPVSGIFEVPFVLWIVGVMNYLLGGQAAPFILWTARVSDVQIAYFTAALAIGVISNRAFMGGFAGVVLASLSRAVVEGRDSFMRMHSLYVRVTAVLSVPMLVGAVVFAPLLTAIWIKGDASEAVGIVRILTLWFLAMRLAGGGAHSAALYAAGLHRLGLLIRVICAGAAVAATYAAAVWSGVFLAAFVSGAAGFLVVVLEWMVLYRKLKVPLPVVDLLRIAAACWIPAVPAWLILKTGTPAAVAAAVCVYFPGVLFALRVARPLLPGESARITGRAAPGRILKLFEKKEKTPPA